MFDQIKDSFNPGKNPDLIHAHEFQRENLPTLWLVGKTGAGKSTFIQTITGLSSVEVGNGFAPCTKTAQVYNFPQDKPLLRFLDTRGLGEADYDPEDDLEEIGQLGHALVVVMKVDEPEQSAVLSALKKIRQKNKIKHLLLIHSAVLLSNKKDRERQIAFNELQVKEIWGSDFKAVAVDFETEDGSVYQYDVLVDVLEEMLPVIGIIADVKEHSTIEEANFDTLKKEVLWYAGSAAASDLIPAIGLVTVPAIQAKLLHSLANQYDVEWNKRTFNEFIGTLGSSFALQYGVKFGVRELIKFVPVYGQTVGAVTAATMSFGTTYGLGRVACYYFYHKSKGLQIPAEIMQDLYKNAFKQGKAASGYEKN
ncbi:YcjF family protein [Leucothrix arctica]|uniref:Kinase n=1 Tax=Leucothrix arctica TaxID=1481894 RepID=A0A317C4F1_9GAMM|nr:GTPase [Leucothrix arctica]PWQ93484.1 kinase [Leucothrix arctica]